MSYAGTLQTSSSGVSAGGNIIVTVTDADLDVNEATADFAQISVQGVRSETTSIRVVETGAATGVFTGAVQAREWGECAVDMWGCSTASMSAAPDSSVYVTPGEVVSLKYADQAPNNNVELMLRTCTLAHLEVHPLVIAVGWDVTITVDDPDKAGANNVTVVVKGGTDEEQLVLLELPNRPGSFLGVLKTSANASHAGRNSGTLYLQSKSVINAMYADSCPLRTVQVSLTATIVGTITLSTSELQKGARLGVTVVDAQVNAPGGTSVDVINVNCRGTSGDTEVVVLTETGPDKGIFTGFCFPGNAGSLSGDLGLDILCTHESLSPPMLLQAATRIVQSYSATVSLSPAIAPAGANVQVTVIDPDLNVAKTAVDQYPALVRLRSGTFEMKLDVRETGINTDVFTAMVQSYDTSFPDDGAQQGKLPTTPGVPITAHYTEEAPFAERSAQIPVRQSYVGELTITNPVGVSGRPRVLVADADLNRNTSAVESTTVQVAVNSPGAPVGTICAATGGFL